MTESGVAFTCNGRPVSVRADHPHLLAALREELDVTSPKDGCSPSGQCGCCTVLVDGKAVVVVPAAAGEGRRARPIVTLEGVDEDERQRYADAFAACGGLQCGFCIPGIVMRAKAQIDKKGADLTREDMAAPPRRPPVPLHRLREDPRRHRGGGRPASRWPSTAPGGIGSRGMKYEARRARPRRPRLHRRPARARACCTPRCASPTTPGPTSGHRHRAAARPRPASSAVFTAADIPGELRVGLIHKDWPVLIPVGGRTSYAGDVLAVVVAETRQQARAAAALVDVDYDVLRPLTDPVAAIDDPEIAVWGTDSNVLSRQSSYARGDVDAALAASAHIVHEMFQTQRIEHAFLEPESTLAVPDPDGGTAARLLRRPGRVGRPQRHRPRARRRPDRRHRRAGLERRRLRRQGGHGEPGADGAGGVAAPAAGEVHAVPRGEPADAPQAPPDPHGVLGRLRRRRQADRAQGAGRRRLGLVRQRRDEGAGADGRPRQRAVPPARPSTSEPSPCAPTTRCAAPSAASAPTRPSSPWRA